MVGGIIIELAINDGFGNFTIFAWPLLLKQFIMAPFRFRF
jgi:DNA/RNA endonuclease YhcR with UshA esterase domain